ncbi:MAG: hypothetical protein E7463_11180 [Ruminococcaceae bacterium]|nr:hypothetical protein [Oscillospiraceae bacterium]
MTRLDGLKKEITIAVQNGEVLYETRDYLMYLGYREHYDDPNPIARAHACASLWLRHHKKVYENDLIPGSRYGLIRELYDVNDATLVKASEIVRNYGIRDFLNNGDHYAPDYAEFLAEGVEGVLERIRRSRERYADDTEKQLFLQAAAISMEAFAEMARQYADAALEAANEAEKTGKTERAAGLREAAAVCRKVSLRKPETFREALQLVWLTYIAFVYETRHAMALGRLDQYLWPFYERDVKAGILTREFAKELIECTLYKIGERQIFFVYDDVVNIAIGGVRADGSDAVNELSYIILEAVRDCGIAGPNLSARLHKGMPDQFLDECLKVIGTGIGYPALMNDEVNIPALARNGYDLEDCRNYCMVGCIENFLPGLQPPWTDDRYNSPMYLELALNDGLSWMTDVQLGPHTGDAATITSMDDFMERLHIQMAAGAAEYMARFRNENDRLNRKNYCEPFMSCLCNHCIERGLDIHNGGTKYPSVHGPGCMGIATMADSLAAIEQVVFTEKKATLTELRDALIADFKGYEELHRRLLDAPKYGNNDDRADKYAVWFVEEHYRLFEKYRTPDGGRIYVAIASNVENIPAGLEVAATPDGRKRGEPLSDAASPMHGMDKSGPTAVVLSTTKPDYTLASCGTVLNQKYSPSMFRDPEKRARLAALIRVYMEKGGQEMQINSVARETLIDAMEHPENYGSMVVRVSGFSATFVTLGRAVQEDILKRTEQE